jgi:3-hydroxyacyl-CoA dehydrogenase
MYRGGPMFWADQVGLRIIRDKLLEWQKHEGAVWKPAPRLERFVVEGKGFVQS